MIRRSAMNTGTKVCKPLDTEVEQKKRWPQQDLHCSRWGVKTDVTVFCDVINKTHDLASLESAAFVNGGYFALILLMI